MLYFKHRIIRIPKDTVTEMTTNINSAEPARIICRRCLLEELGEEDLLRSLDELKAAMPEADRADSAEYERRLSECRKCDELNDGTCAKCGCYVEFRALKKRMHCPHENRKW